LVLAYLNLGPLYKMARDRERHAPEGLARFRRGPEPGCPAGKLKLTPHPKGRRFCGISFSLSKRAELAPAFQAMMRPGQDVAPAYKEAIPKVRAALAGLQ
jgi:hypothetical protein